MESPGIERHLWAKAGTVALQAQQCWALLLSQMLADTAFFPPIESGALLRTHSLTVGPLAILLQTDRVLNPLSHSYEPTPLPYGLAARAALLWLKAALACTDEESLLIGRQVPVTFSALAFDISWEAVVEQLKRLAYLRIRLSQTDPQAPKQLLRLALFEEITYTRSAEEFALRLSSGFRQSLLTHEFPTKSESLKNEKKGVATKAASTSFCA